MSLIATPFPIIRPPTCVEPRVVMFAIWRWYPGVLAFDQGYRRTVARQLVGACRADDPTLVMKLSDGSIIAGNVLGRREADAAEVARRIESFHVPYHAAIDAALDRIGPHAVVISMHSFTPAWKGKLRPWQVGVLYDRDTRLAAPLRTRLEEAGFIVGDNEPYAVREGSDYTIPVHGAGRGLIHTGIEIRQDLITEEKGQREWAERLARIFKALEAPLLELS